MFSTSSSSKIYRFSLSFLSSVFHLFWWSRPGPFYQVRSLLVLVEMVVSDGQQISSTTKISHEGVLGCRWSEDEDHFERIFVKTFFPIVKQATICDNWKHFFDDLSHYDEKFLVIQFSPLVISDAERSYRSDCETDDGISLANDNEFMNGSSSQQLTRMRNRSPLGSKRGVMVGQPSSPFPNEMTNRRMQNAHERLRNGEWSCKFMKSDT